MSHDAFDPFAETGNDDQEWSPSDAEGQAISNAGEWGAISPDEIGKEIVEAPYLFVDDPFVTTSTSEKESDDNVSKVVVAVHEQLTSLYDGNSEVPPNCQVEGSVHVQSTSDAPFCLVVRDDDNIIATFDSDPRLCQDITQSNASTIVDDGIRVLRVTLPEGSCKQLKIFTYQCDPKLRPIPLLVKTKVQVAKQHCRLGIKIRSNPERMQSLIHVAIIIAIPPDVHGESVRLSRNGGVWDSMKRIVTWSVETLGPGELLEIQAQFEFVGGESSLSRSPKFPVLVRCDSPKEQFSNIEFSSDFTDQSSSPTKLSFVQSVRIMHRKV